MSWQLLQGDARERLRELPAESVQTCVTSPPYFGLRDYGTGQWDGGDPACDHQKVSDKDAAVSSSTLGGGKKTTGHIQEGFGGECGRCGARRVDNQIGLEPTPDEFVVALVETFREVRRVLRDDGTVWLNLGDSYCSTDKWGGGVGGNTGKHTTNGEDVPSWAVRRKRGHYADVKPKDLLGVPWLVAFALRADGWYLRSDIIWAKPNPMPESVTDRPTKAHEYLFLLSKSPRYYYDAYAIAEGVAESTPARLDAIRHDGPLVKVDASRNDAKPDMAVGNGTSRNKRTVWTIATQPYPGAHFATFPPKLIEPCILAGSSDRACGECGTPWQRVTERTPMVVRPAEKRAGWQATDDHARTQVGGTMLEPPSSRTVGWESSCEHDDDSGSSVVLDPFAGAGTTGVVALRHQRSFVGVELNPEYVELARWRILDDAPLLNSHSEIAA